MKFIQYVLKTSPITNLLELIIKYLIPFSLLLWFSVSAEAAYPALYNNSICQGSCQQVQVMSGVGYAESPIDSKSNYQSMPGVCHARLGRPVVADILAVGGAQYSCRRTNVPNPYNQHMNVPPCPAECNSYSSSTPNPSVLLHQTCFKIDCLVYARCGNGRLEYGERCDNGPNDKYCSCGSGIIGRCGDNIIQKQASETCDDGNTTNGDGCSSSCQIESGCTCPGTTSSPIAGACSCNAAPSISATPGPTEATLKTHTNDFNSGRKLGTLSVSDSNKSDTVTVSVKSVSVSGESLPSSISDSERLAMLKLSKTTVLTSSQTSGTFDWSFDPGNQKFDFMDFGQSTTLTYTLEAKDNKNTTSTVTIKVTVKRTQCDQDTDCVKISEAKPYCSNDNICYNDTPSFSGKKNHTLDLNKTNEISGKITVTDNNTSDTVFLFVKDINDVNNNSGMSTAELRKMLQPSIVPQLINRQQTSGDYNWSLKITNDKQISSEVKLSYTLEARDKNNAVSSYQLNFTIIPRDPAVNTNSDFTDSPPLATPSTDPVNTTDNIMDDSSTQDSESSFTTEESTDATSSSTSPTPSSDNVLLECKNKVHPNSDLKLSTGDTVERCITRKGGQTISCTVKDPGTFGGKMSVECSEAIKKCVSEQTLTNKRGKKRTTTRASVAGCKVVK